jgi:hypothetical protein
MPFTKRDIGIMILLLIVTFGFYLIYWLAVTKDELNRQGAHIPTTWLFIIPFANLYFFYKFSEGFARYVIRDDSQTLIYFLLLVFLPPVAQLICQAKMNEFIDTHSL